MPQRCVRRNHTSFLWNQRPSAKFTLNWYAKKKNGRMSNLRFNWSKADNWYDTTEFSLKNVEYIKAEYQTAESIAYYYVPRCFQTICGNNKFPFVNAHSMIHSIIFFCNNSPRRNFCKDRGSPTCQNSSSFGAKFS